MDTASQVRQLQGFTGWGALGSVLPGNESEKRDAAEALLDSGLAKLRNRNTREAYLFGWRNFFDWCAQNGLALDGVRPRHVGLWLDGHTGSAATARQHLASVRFLCQELLLRGFLDQNPALAVRGPRLDVETGLTPVLRDEEVSRFLAGIGDRRLIDKRDYALFSVLLYTFCRVSALTGLRVEDYRGQGGGRCVRFREKRSKVFELPLHPRAEAAVDVWLDASALGQFAERPLFPAFEADRETLSDRPMDRSSVWVRVKRRLVDAGLETRYGCHSFRATGVTLFIQNGGTLRTAGRIARHRQMAATQRYDRTEDVVLAQELDRVRIPDPPAGA